MSVIVRSLLVSLVSVVLGVQAGAVAAQEWPARPVRILVAFAPGGLADVVARLFAQHLEARTGKPVTVENRSGAGGIVGTQAVAQSAPDGYTLLLTTSAPHGSGPALYKTLPYDPVADFSHISLLGKAPIFLMSKAGEGPQDLAAFVREGRAAAAPLRYGSPGAGSLGHLTGALIGISTGVAMEHVPYRGSVPAQVDLLGGRINVVSDNLPAHIGQVKAGAIKLLAVSTPERIAAASGVPTFTELGYPAISAAAWFALAAPAGLPERVLQQLHRHSLDFVAQPGISAKLQELGLVPEASASPAAYRTFVQAEIARWKDVVRKAGIAQE